VGDFEVAIRASKLRYEKGTLNERYMIAGEQVFNITENNLKLK
jgi:hypothetical protein